mgnify:CR=1 FL=1
MNCQGYMMNTNELEKNRLLTKKDFNIFFLPHELHEFKKMSISDIKGFGKKEHILYDVRYLFDSKDVDGRL